MAAISVVQIYDNLRAVENALRILDSGGISMDGVSIMTQGVRTEPVPYDDIAGEHTTASAWVSSPLGLLAGAVSLWIPGFGLLVITGPVVATFLDSADTGGGMAALWYRLGISHSVSIRYEQLLREGKYLLVVTGTAGDIYRVLMLRHKTCALETDVRTLPVSPTLSMPQRSIPCDWNTRCQPKVPLGSRTVRRNVR